MRYRQDTIEITQNSHDLITSIDRTEAERHQHRHGSLSLSVSIMRSKIHPDPVQSTSKEPQIRLDKPLGTRTQISNENPSKSRCQGSAKGKTRVDGSNHLPGAVAHESAERDTAAARETEEKPLETSPSLVAFQTRS